MPPSSETRRFNGKPANIREAKTAEAWTNLDEWFDGAPNLEMKEDVVGLGTYGKTLTILFTDEVLDEEDD